MTKFYFLGIGGTAMASVAGAFAKLGHSVTGSDSGVYPPMSDFLREAGISYFETYSEQYLITAAPDIIVVGNAISRGNPELEYALDQRLSFISMTEAVRSELIRQNTSVVITGTHGKTTTTSVASWLLESGGLTPGFLIGGIPENFGYGCRPAKIPNGHKYGFFVTEGDEYDTAFFDKRSKFLHYRPDIAVINNIEFDHADIFSSLAEIELSFRRFVNLIPRSGVLLINNEDAVAKRVSEKSFAPVQTFGLNGNAFWQATEIEYGSDKTSFSVLREGKLVGRFSSPLFGEHNCRNVLATIAVATHAGLSPEHIQTGLSSFKSPKRRLEVLGEFDGITLIDDFAHHPTAIHETLKAVRQKYPERRMVVCFEPRSNTTTRNIFQKELAGCFELAGVVAIGPISRPERYALSERLDTRKLVSDLEAKGKIAYATPVPAPAAYVREIADFVCKQVKADDVILLLSNGNFGGLATELRQRFSASKTGN
ncbi:MAG: UDP-N-acetylmuramate:L-alanyl-gamma-D-glutamyl-meso-diaminopimelate ligase [Chlorobiales bacterium]|nr:UDP-N-acetylmuramate:L-alanyl-gamma-D-glutamyl-meso-diaminopimelate ligase [Chlorobiales bacterium]